MNVLRTVGLVGFLLVTAAQGRTNPNTITKSCRSDDECAYGQTCDAAFGICNNKPQPTTDSTSANCICKAGEYCHPVFESCVPRLVPPLPQTNRNTARARKCSSTGGCRSGEYCHPHFRLCLPHVTIPTTTPTTSSRRSCKQDRDCAGQGEYCHEIFRFCLVLPTGYINVPTPTPTVQCITNSECKSGQYCHGVLHKCLNIYTISNVAVPIKRLLSRSCSSDSWCRSSDYCLFSQAQDSSTLSRRHRRLRCGRMSNCPTRTREGATGVCVRRRELKCSSEEDCDAGMTCLRSLRVCMTYKQSGEACLVQMVPFVSPCDSGLTCVPMPNGKKLKGRRLEKKLRIPKFIRKRPAVKNMVRKKYLLGRCHAIKV